MGLLKKFKVMLAGAMLAGFATSAAAEFPEKPITLIVGFSAGGGVDLFARTFASVAEDQFGVPLVIVNQPGAASANAARQVVRSRPDGYTLLLTNASSLASHEILAGEKANVNMAEELRNLGSIGGLVTALMVPAGSQFQTAEELVAHARENPGQLRWAHPGRGSLHMLGGAVFLAENGITAQDVPFKGGSKARNALAGEQVDFGFVGVQLISGFESQLRALGVTSAARDPIFSTVPTFEEEGLPQMQLSGPITLFAPAEVPEEVAEKLIAAIEAVAASDAYDTKAKEASLSAGYMTPGEVEAALETLTGKVTPVIEEMNAGQ